MVQVVSFFLISITLLRGVLGNVTSKSYEKTKVSYPLKEFRVVGGMETRIENVPFNVQFFNMGGMCGGTILAKKIVLTAAHCFDINVNVDEMKILSGSRFVFDPRSVAHNVWRFKIHEEYNRSMYFENDIALIIIEDEFVYSRTVKKAFICNNDVWMKSNESFLVTGWGEIKYGTGVHKRQRLMTTLLQYISKIKCNLLNEVNLSEDMFCLYGDGKRDTCRGDSGGGVFWYGMLVGITSHGRGCASVPSVYVNVYYMKRWIDTTVEQLYKQFCKT